MYSSATFAIPRRDNQEPDPIRVVHGAYTAGPLEFRGQASCSGPQPVGVVGGCPEWVWQLLEDRPDIEAVSISGERWGVVWRRLARDPDRNVVVSPDLGSDLVTGAMCGISAWDRALIPWFEECTTVQAVYCDRFQRVSDAATLVYPADSRLPAVVWEASKVEPMVAEGACYILLFEDGEGAIISADSFSKRFEVVK